MSVQPFAPSRRTGMVDTTGAAVKNLPGCRAAESPASGPLQVLAGPRNQANRGTEPSKSDSALSL